MGASPIFPSRHHPAGPSCYARVASLRLLRGHFKRQRLAEPVRLPYPEGDSRCHPYGSKNLCRNAQAPPQSEANEKAKQRRYEVHHVFLSVHKVTHESCRIHTHERNQRAKIQELDAASVRQEKRTDQDDHADKHYIVARNVVLRDRKSVV